ncbi:RNA polymerase sigma-70 factor [Parabacteroides sp. FAFU027]|uniref:RNA polymerase sigma-70 factor n=1 Tax=Parabacteroides sp. FAFU027 TaxID=2922715 RepID=UPI001FAEA4B7|nr:RNA polymerase sigma-70 factor [Parabacteroides sp. FAFU027]
MKNRIVDTNLHLSDFKEIYRKLYPKLSVYATLFLSQDEAHDVVQEVFVSVWENQSLIMEEASIHSYLYRAVYNRCIDVLRKQYTKEQYASTVRTEILEKEANYFHPDNHEIENRLFSQELYDTVHSEIEKLPAKCQEVFRLYYYEQKSAKEISEALDLSRSTVENHIYNGMKTLKKRFSNYQFILFLLLIQLPQW